MRASNIATVAVAASLAVTSSSCAPARGPSGAPTVVEVVDGDTIVVRVGGRDETTRLIGVDTPETKHPTKPVECFGPEAAEFTRRVLPPRTEVRLERDAEVRDHFGRLLAYVYRAHDGAFVNLELVRRGFARPLRIPPNDAHTGDLAAAADDARAHARGLWEACTGAP